MTTNIYDGNAKIMACDSRWSIPYGNWVFYLDDSGYEKILRHTSYSLMFAERVTKFGFRDWIRSSRKMRAVCPLSRAWLYAWCKIPVVISHLLHHDIDTQKCCAQLRCFGGVWLLKEQMLQKSC
jgi:hypothetical protein